MIAYIIFLSLACNFFVLGSGSNSKGSPPTLSLPPQNSSVLDTVSVIGAASKNSRNGTEITVQFNRVPYIVDEHVLYRPIFVTTDALKVITTEMRDLRTSQHILEQRLKQLKDPDGVSLLNGNARYAMAAIAQLDVRLSRHRKSIDRLESSMRQHAQELQTLKTVQATHADDLAISLEQKMQQQLAQHKAEMAHIITDRDRRMKSQQKQLVQQQTSIVEMQKEQSRLDKVLFYGLAACAVWASWTAYWQKD